MSDHQNDGFLRRWSNRKSEARQGKALSPDSTPDVQAQSRAASDQPAAVQSTNSTAAAPAPTLDDVGQLTPSSDFRAFVRHEVPADVKNAAMKKLFADPHFNVMDGLDVYIDDYSHPDPLAPAMLRQMTSAKFLELVEEPKESMLAAPGQDVAADSACETVAQYQPRRSPPQDPDHDHADMRLQPDSDAGPQDTGPNPV